MITALFIITLAAFTYVETYCGYTLYKRGKWLSERNRQKRVNVYRAAAYAKQRQLKVIKGNRESLWADISKE